MRHRQYMLADQLLKTHPKYWRYWSIKSNTIDNNMLFFPEVSNNRSYISINSHGNKITAKTIRSRSIIPWTIKFFKKKMGGLGEHLEILFEIVQELSRCQEEVLSGWVGLSKCP